MVFSFAVSVVSMMMRGHPLKSSKTLSFSIIKLLVAFDVNQFAALNAIEPEVSAFSSHPLSLLY